MTLGRRRTLIRRKRPRPNGAGPSYAYRARRGTGVQWVPSAPQFQFSFVNLVPNRSSARKSPDARPGLRRLVGEASNEGIHMDRLSLSPHGCAINAVRGKQSLTEFAREAIAREVQRRLTEAEKGRK